MDDFGDFYVASKDGVFRAVLAATGDRGGAEDAVSEAYARAYARWTTVREHPEPVAWVVLTALNVRRSIWRRLRREVLGPTPERAAASGNPGGGGLSDGVRTAVAGLPRRQREVVALRLLADLSAEQTGDVLGMAAATVHVHLHRALATLKVQLAAMSLQDADSVEEVGP